MISNTLVLSIILGKGFDFTSDVVRAEAPTEPGLFLGCLHDGYQVLIKGKDANMVIYNTEVYLEITVKIFIAMVDEFAGETVSSLTKCNVPTPFSTKCHKDVPVGKPCGGSVGCVVCMHCQAYFPSWGNCKILHGICGAGGIERIQARYLPFVSQFYRGCNDHPKRVADDLERGAFNTNAL